MNDTFTTILAMLAGFITAFLAEPVKIYFQNKSRMRDLRVGLYKEMWNNYLTCKYSSENLQKNFDELSADNTEAIKVTLESSSSLIKDQIRTECYQRALKEDLLLFYRLSESQWINLLREDLSILLKDMKIDYEPKLLDLLILSDFCGEYVTGFSQSLIDGRLDKKFFIKVVGRYSYELVLENSYQKTKTQKSLSINFPQ